MRNIKAKTNLEKNVETVDSHISLEECLISDSSEIWMPNASENASAIAIVSIPPITASFEFVPECRPTISPSVVIIPEVMPKLNPIFNECLTIIVHISNNFSGSTRCSHASHLFNKDICSQSTNILRILGGSFT